MHRLCVKVLVKSSEILADRVGNNFFCNVLLQAQLALITKFVNAARYCCEIRNYSTCIQIIDALEMFVIRQLPVSYQPDMRQALIGSFFYD